MNSQNNVQESYYLAIQFEYGNLDKKIYWIKSPQGKFLQLDDFSMQIVFELNRGISVNEVCIKYHVTREAVASLVNRLYQAGSVVQIGTGQIIYRRTVQDINIIPWTILILFLFLINAEYFQNYAKTYILRHWIEGIIVALFSMIFVFFHEFGHYIVCRKYFKPKVGFSLFLIFPAVYVNTQESWRLPKHIRLLINSSGVLADMLVNSVVVLFVIKNMQYEYYITPFLLTQFTRMSLTLNPLFKGDGYWIMSDLAGVINLKEKAFQSLREFKLDLLSLYAVITGILSILSGIGFIWFLFNIFKGLINRLI